MKKDRSELSDIEKPASRQEAEKALRNSEEIYRHLFEQAADAIFISDSEGRIIDANQAACSSLGYCREDLLSMFLWQLNPEKWSKKSVGDLVDKLQPGEIYTFESSHRRQSGSWFPIEVKVCCFDANGKRYSLDLVRDITERKKAQEALQKAHDKLEQRVQERTVELSEANTALQKALAEVEILKNRIQAENVYLQEEIKLQNNFEEIVTQSKIFNKVLRKVEQVAATDATVLVLGETGTGKELIARAVHNLSARRQRPLVKINCAALPANLIESELFGHEKGAFTGALAKKIGRFELANEGTIFLDEIGDLSMELQAKLLRVLQEGEFERLGNANTLKVNVRVIAATNRNLDAEIEQGKFREDLYYRLNVFPILLPPLRERKEDIPLLVRHFVKKFSPRAGKHIEAVPQKVMDTLQAYQWPGNVRELENIIERAVIVSRGKLLELGDWLPRQIASSGISGIPTLEENEKALILEALERTNWRVSGEKGAAKILAINPQTLVSRMKKLGIRRESSI